MGEGAGRPSERGMSIICSIDNGVFNAQRLNRGHVWTLNSWNMKNLVQHPSCGAVEAVNSHVHGYEAGIWIVLNTSLEDEQ